VRAFRYHQAAASPPASTDAAATIPSLSQPGDAEPAVCEVEEVEDSKELVMFLMGLIRDRRCNVRQKGSWVLDAPHSQNDRLLDREK